MEELGWAWSDKAVGSVPDRIWVEEAAPGCPARRLLLGSRYGGGAAARQISRLNDRSDTGEENCF